LRNRWIVIGVLAQIAMMAIIVYLPLLQQVFSTAPLAATEWVIIYTIAPIALIIAEIVKRIVVAIKTT
jgi:magnesium-transporting ATPase (P-type)